MYVHMYIHIHVHTTIKKDKLTDNNGVSFQQQLLIFIKRCKHRMDTKAKILECLKPQTCTHISMYLYVRKTTPLPERLDCTICRA